MAFLTAPALRATPGPRPRTLCPARPRTSLQTAPRPITCAIVYVALSEQLNENVSEIAKSVSKKSHVAAEKTFDAAIYARDRLGEIAGHGAKATKAKVVERAKGTGERLIDGSKSGGSAMLKGAEDVTGWMKDKLKD
mmetsp:Transcript_25372/g.66584  ORF Transcript_25372/g.66584 Transcript_25372/m.66584 type:complete len:137 (-) Transcript_25372:102-512(-)